LLFAKRVFTWAGIYGVAIVTPLYFAEWLLVRLYGPMTFPVAYYGFIGVVLTFQLAYLLIGRDPVRFRPVMPLAILGKTSFGVTALVLYALGRLPLPLLLICMPDLIWAAVFVWAYARTPKE
jgi:hypothetical protein